MTTKLFQLLLARRPLSNCEILVRFFAVFAASVVGAEVNARSAEEVSGTVVDGATAGIDGSEVSSTVDDFPRRLPVAGGEVILPTPGAQRAHDMYRFAAARRSGDVLYLSGVIIGRRPDEGRDTEQFKSQVRRAFERVGTTLAASCATFESIVKITSFHVWNSPEFSGDRDAQFTAFSEVVGEYIPAPYPAWTAVGTTGLLGEGGIVEVEFIAHLAPENRTCPAD